MDPNHKKILLDNRLELVRNVIVNEELLAVLRIDNVITADMQETIESKVTSQQKAAYLLDLLPRRGKKAFDRFVRALRESEQKHLAFLLSGVRDEVPMEVDYTDTADDWMRNMDDVVKIIEAAGPYADKPGIMNIKVKPMTEDFRSTLKQQHDVYEIRQGKTALAIVINNLFFSASGFEARHGSDYDKENTKHLFELFNFEVIVRDNQTAKEILGELEAAKKRLNGGAYDIFLFFIMSHGARGVVYGFDGAELNIYQDILAHFSDEKCPIMAGKPKLFFMQACQGSKLTVSVPATSNEANKKTDGNERTDGCRELIDTSSAVWNNPDIMLAFATAEGSEAFRHPDRGSWFIRAIVYVFSNRACKEHLINLMTQVCNIVSNFRGKGHYTQIAERKDTLSKRLYFTS